MKLKLIIDDTLLKPFYQQTFSKTLLIYPDALLSQAPTVTRLLSFVFESFKFVLLDQLKPALLYLCTHDGFLLPPNAAVADCLDQNQVVRLMSVKAPPSKPQVDLFGVKHPPAKKVVLDVKSSDSSEESSSSSSSSSSEEIAKRKRDVKAVEKAKTKEKKIDKKAMVEKIT